MTWSNIFWDRTIRSKEKMRFEPRTPRMKNALDAIKNVHKVPSIAFDHLCCLKVLRSLWIVSFSVTLSVQRSIKRVIEKETIQSEPRTLRQQRWSKAIKGTVWTFFVASSTLWIGPSESICSSSIIQLLPGHSCSLSPEKHTLWSNCQIELGMLPTWFDLLAQHHSAAGRKFKGLLINIYSTECQEA